MELEGALNLEEEEEEEVLTLIQTLRLPLFWHGEWRREWRVILASGSPSADECQCHAVDHPVSRREEEEEEEEEEQDKEEFICPN